MNKQGSFRLYGPLFDQGDGGSGGNSDQTDWKAKYEALNAQITSGQYVQQASYVTLQRNLENAVNERKTLQSSLDSATAKVSLLTEDTGKLQTKITDLQSTVGAKDTEIAGRDAKLSRHTVIFKEFPELASFEADGLLPTPAGDQRLEDVLKAFSTRVTGLQERARTDFRQGESKEPRPVLPDGSKTAKTLFSEALELQTKGDTKGYDAKMDQYYAAKKTEATAASA